MKQFPFEKLGFLHGGDYNPDQWLDRPDILEKDIEYMKQVKVNCVSLGIFSWTMLEPEDGVYQLDWLNEIIDRLYENGIYTVLATPSGARPAWMAKAHPEVLRVNEKYEKMHFGERHNHCLTSPYYREKVRKIDTELAKRFAHHPAVILWHISNEFGGQCYCEHCQSEFRAWLRNKYGTLDRLNKCWCTGVWSQIYTDWEQIEAPSPLGEISCVSMRVDWMRFETEQCRSFIRMEKETVQAFNPDIPVTANLMYRFWDYNYFDLARELDVVSWDSYPEWHKDDDARLAADFAMQHDIMRSLKRAPFLLMESTPSLVNWKPVNKLKKPGMHLLSSLQAVAHGSQSVQYFQWRKCVGGPEAFHGAVVSHDNRNNTRVFRDVQSVGNALCSLKEIYDTRVQAKVCILYDWENRWAVDFSQAGYTNNMRYTDAVLKHYRPLWRKGISCDFADMSKETDLDGYDLVIAPMLFMFRNGIQEKLRSYVEKGGNLVMSYFSGIVDEFDLAMLGDAPNGLTDVLGLRVSEMDALYPDQHNRCEIAGSTYQIDRLCELTEDVSADVLSVYKEDFYAGSAMLTRNKYGKGKAWYLAAELCDEGMCAMYEQILAECGMFSEFSLPAGVVCSKRDDVYFLQNYSGERKEVPLPCPFTDLLGRRELCGSVTLEPYDIKVMKKL